MVEAAGPEAPGSGATHPVQRLTRPGMIWRAVVTIVAIGVLAYGQIAHTNDLFPFGSLSQYGNAQTMNGQVRSTFLEAEVQGAPGEVRRISLDRFVTGLERSEVEGQLGRVIDNPEMLQDLAEAYSALNPDEPALTHLFLRRSTTAIVNGRTSGEPEIQTLAEWEVSR